MLSPRLLIVMVNCPCGRFAVASLHAHDQSCTNLYEWWSEVIALFAVGINVPLKICADCITTVPEVWDIRKP